MFLREEGCGCGTPVIHFPRDTANLPSRRLPAYSSANMEDAWIALITVIGIIVAGVICIALIEKYGHYLDRDTVEIIALPGTRPPKTPKPSPRGRDDSVTPRSMTIVISESPSQSSPRRNAVANIVPGIDNMHLAVPDPTSPRITRPPLHVFRASVIEIDG